MDEKMLKQIHTVTVTCWKAFREFEQSRRTGEDWKRFLEATEKLTEQHEADKDVFQFAKDIALSYVCLAERKERNISHER